MTACPENERIHVGGNLHVRESYVGCGIARGERAVDVTLKIGRIRNGKVAEVRADGDVVQRVAAAGPEYGAAVADVYTGAAVGDAHLTCDGGLARHFQREVVVRTFDVDAGFDVLVVSVDIHVSLHVEGPFGRDAEIENGVADRGELTFDPDSPVGFGSAAGDQEIHGIIVPVVSGRNGEALTGL